MQPNTKKITLLGRRIREVRLAKKLTQSDVVKDYMTRNMLSKIENGSAAPSVRTLEYLAAELDVPVSYFLDGEDREHVDSEQLREIDDIARMLKYFIEDAGIAVIPGVELCLLARTRLAAGRYDAALSMFENIDMEIYPKELHSFIYGAIEDCYKFKGNYRRAYEYALKRLDCFKWDENEDWRTQ